ncbi:hypothetical protein DFH28DRAFT_951300 [Melampsora americana]|nr:hypothetical protein DFH28DRAFT_951300 [Melampsora americana]
MIIMSWLQHTYRLFNTHLIFYLTIQATRCMEYHSENSIVRMFDKNTHHGNFIWEDQRIPPASRPNVPHGIQDLPPLDLAPDLWSNQISSISEEARRDSVNFYNQIQSDVSQNQWDMWNSQNTVIQGLENDFQPPGLPVNTYIGICPTDQTPHIDWVNSKELAEFDIPGLIQYPSRNSNDLHDPITYLAARSQSPSSPDQIHASVPSNGIHSGSIALEKLVYSDSHWHSFDQIKTPSINHANIYTASDGNSLYLPSPITQSMGSKVHTIDDQILQGNGDPFSRGIYNHHNTDSGKFQMHNELMINVFSGHHSHTWDNLQPDASFSKNTPGDLGSFQDVQPLGESEGNGNTGWEDIMNLSTSLLKSSSTDTAHNNKRKSGITRMEKLKNLKTSTETRLEGNVDHKVTKVPQNVQTITLYQHLKNSGTFSRHLSRTVLKSLREQGRRVLSEDSDLEKTNEIWHSEWQKRYQCCIDNLDVTRSITNLVRKDLERVKSRVKDGVVIVFLGLVYQIDRSDNPQIDGHTLLKDSLKFIQGYLDRLAAFDTQSLQAIDLQTPLGGSGSITPLRVLHEIALYKRRSEIRLEVYYHIWRTWRLEKTPSLQVYSYPTWFTTLKNLTLQSHVKIENSLEATSNHFSSISAFPKAFDRTNSRTHILKQGRLCIESIMMVHDEVAEFYNNLELKLLGRINQLQSLEPNEIRHFKRRLESSIKISKLVIVPEVFGVVKMIIDHQSEDFDSLERILEDVWVFLQRQFSIITTLDLDNTFIQVPIEMRKAFADIFEEPGYMSMVFKQLIGGTFNTNYKPIIWSLVKKWTSSSSKLTSNADYIKRTLEEYTDTYFTTFVQAMAIP